MFSWCIRTKSLNKQCSPRLGAAEHGVWSESNMFTIYPAFSHTWTGVKWVCSNFRSSTVRNSDVSTLIVKYGLHVRSKIYFDSSLNYTACKITETGYMGMFSYPFLFMLEKKIYKRKIVQNMSNTELGLPVTPRRKINKPWQTVYMSQTKEKQSFPNEVITILPISVWRPQKG